MAQLINHLATHRFSPPSFPLKGRVGSDSALFSHFKFHEAAQGDEGRSLGAGLQELASNHLKLLKTVLFEVRGWKNHGPLKEDLVEVSGLLRPILRSLFLNLVSIYLQRLFYTLRL